MKLLSENDMKQINLGLFFHFLCILPLEYLSASGFDVGANAKSITMEISEGCVVRAKKNDKGFLEMLSVDFAGREVPVPIGSLEDLEEVDLQSIKVRVEYSAKSKDAASRMISIEFTFGENRIWSAGPLGEILAMPCVRFVFNGSKISTRYKFKPAEKEGEWKAFVKNPGTEEKEIQPWIGKASPLTGISEVIISPNETTTEPGSK